MSQDECRQVEEHLAELIEADETALFLRHEKRAELIAHARSCVVCSQGSSRTGRIC